MGAAATFMDDNQFIALRRGHRCETGWAINESSTPEIRRLLDIGTGPRVMGKLE
jgi:hypothetical protein